MMTSSIFNIILILFASFQYTRAVQSDCRCWVERSMRSACPAGAFLPEDTCTRAGCCASLPEPGELPTDIPRPDAGVFDNSPTCFRRLESCHPLDQCHIRPSKRQACPKVHWRAGRRLCQFRGCCFDETQPPFCFRAKSEYYGGSPRSPTGYFEPSVPAPRDFRVKGSQEPPTEPPLIDVLKKQLHAYEESVAFKDSIGRLNNGDLVIVHCAYSPHATKCGSDITTKYECVSKACCWNPQFAAKFNSTRCIRPTIMRMAKEEENIRTGDDITVRLLKDQDEDDRLQKMYEEDTNEEEEYEEKKIEHDVKEEEYEEVKDEIIPNGNLGVFVKTCKTLDGDRDPCEKIVNNKDECIINSCCWDNSAGSDDPTTTCYAPAVLYEPMVTYPNQSDDSMVEWLPFDLEGLRSGLEASTDMNNYVKKMSSSPSLELFYDGFSVTLTCPDTSKGAIPCKGGNTRKLCLSMFCCWVSNEYTYGSSCVTPDVTFADKGDPEVSNEEYATEILNEPDFWRPSLPEKNLIKDEEIVTIYCPRETDEVIQCGNKKNVTRRECIASGCCWRPWLVLDTENLPPCQVPSVQTDSIASVLQPQFQGVNDYGSGARWERWNDWSQCRPIGQCSNQGRQYRDRFCSSRSGVHLHSARDVSKCIGAAFEVRLCNNFTACDVTSWTQWTRWSDCSESCQSGNSIRTRTCLPPSGCFLDFPLEEPSTEVDRRVCNTEMCEKWGPWNDHGDCDAGCEGNGTSTRYRTCEKFSHSEGRFTIFEKIAIIKMAEPARSDLRSLVPSQPESFAVHEDECIVQRIPCYSEESCIYQWEDWSNWTDCDTDCGQGKRFRFRRCLWIPPGGDAVIVRNSSCPGFGNDSATEEEICGEGRCLAWADWRESVPCNAACDEIGFRTKERNCSSEEEFSIITQPKSCFSQSERCLGAPCPVTFWDSWGSWSSTCEGSCSPGVMTRARQCKMRGYDSWVSSELCVGASIQTKYCNEEFCKIWGNWTEGGCEAQCGERGVKRSRRSCLDEDHDSDMTVKKSEAIFSSDTPYKCYTTSTQCTRRCENRWEEWGQWSSCSASCTAGSRKRFRRCLREDGVAVGKRFCFKDGYGDSQDGACNTHMCQSWDPWVKGECMGRCKTRGTRLSNRTCSGHDLEWLMSTYINESATCYQTTSPCQPICARWGKWGNFSECSDDCGPGRMSRHRLCTRGNKVVPRMNCNPTSGRVFEEKDCNIFFCSSYGRWKNEYFCEGKCGATNSTRGRTRECFSGIAPKRCLTGRVSCRPRCGPGWGPWGTWSNCNEKCAPGTRKRSRDCLNGDDLLDAETCQKLTGEKEMETEKCNVDFCTSWTEWQKTVCPAKCNKVGIQRRNRICSEHTTARIPHDCWSDTYTCTGECRATWSQWTAWTQCTTSCGPGKQTSVRRCTQNGLVVNPRKCEKNKKPQTLKSRQCYTFMCDNWSKWKAGPCTVVCGGSGTATRSRECLDAGLMSPPEASYDTSCYKREEQCGTDACPKQYQAWSQWSICSNICSPGSQRRTRQCVTNGFAQGDCSSLGPAVEKKPCNTIMCPKWKPWTYEAPCSGRCGAEGRRVRARNCAKTNMTIPQIRSSHPEQCYRGEMPCRSDPC